MDQLILKLANISYLINNPLPINNLGQLNIDRLECISILVRVFLLNLRENTDYITTLPSNANLFFHSWLYTYEPPESAFQKKHDHLIGIFHPYGSIHAHNNSQYLNNLVLIEQNYHSPSDFSPNNSQIYIDLTNNGKAIVACVDCGIGILKGRIELLIYLIDNEYNAYNVDLIDAERRINTEPISCRDFIKTISKLNGLELLYSDDLKLLFNDENTNLVNKPASLGRAKNFNESLVVCNYGLGAIHTIVYNVILNINFPISTDKIPYFNEIRTNLLTKRPDLTDINWEFGIQIISAPV